jgi:predicted transport protein
MTFKAYLDNIKAKTGKTPDDFKKLAKEKGLTKHAELLAWLKAEFGLGHGHANAIIHVINVAEAPKVTNDEAIDKHFGGAKEKWRKPYEALLEKLNTFGDDVKVAPTKTYLSLLRKDKKFAIVQVTADRLDVGIKLKGAAAEGRFEEAGAWNTMVTHRVKIDDAKQIDAEVLKWLKDAYEKA